MQRPFVLINFAITADGKIATANRAVSTFSSARDREHMLELRATVDAVMSGARTVDLNPITMGPGPAYYRRRRVKAGLNEYNLRVVVSGSGTVDPRAEVFQKGFSPVIVLCAGNVSERRLRQLKEVAAEVKCFGTTRLNFSAALQWLRKKWKVKRLLCEGGGELNDALLREDLVDELHLTVCPKVFGGREGPTMADGDGAGNLAKATQMRVVSAKRVGDEMFFVFRRVKR